MTKNCRKWWKEICQMLLKRIFVVCFYKSGLLSHIPVTFSQMWPWTTVSWVQHFGQLPITLSLFCMVILSSICSFKIYIVHSFLYLHCFRNFTLELCLYNIWTLDNGGSPEWVKSLVCWRHGYSHVKDKDPKASDTWKMAKASFRTLGSVKWQNLSWMSKGEVWQCADDALKRLFLPTLAKLVPSIQRYKIPLPASLFICM